MSDGYSAIIIGGTGAVGGSLVRELLASPRCTKLVTVGRRVIADLDDKKVDQRAIDLGKLEAEVTSAASGCTVAFSTMGVGQPSKVPREEFERVDLEYNLAFGRACRAAGVNHLSLLSSVAADAKSRTHYLHVKGKLEDGLAALGFARVSFFRPSVLVTKELRYGFQDRLTQSGFPLVSWMLPSRFHQIPVEDLARAMRINAERPPTAPVEVLHYADFQRLIGET